MTVVYVQNKDGKPLMPTTRCGHVRRLLKAGEARVVERNPFTIRLNYETEDLVQPLYLGIDPGRTNIGLAAIEEKGNTVFTAHVETRNKEVPKLMTERREHRMKHRQLGRRAKRRRRARAANTVKADVFDRIMPGYEKPVILHDIRNKEARFNHRVRSDGWLTPTANHLLQTHLNAVRLVAKHLPVSDVVLELNKFAFMELDNPHILPWKYQKGPLYGYHGDVHQAVYEQQEGHCLFCENEIRHYHHLVPKHEGGSNSFANIAGLCEEHHGFVHTDPVWKAKLASLKEGLNKKHGALSVLNQIIPYLEEELADRYPGHTYAVDGRDTKAYRDFEGVAKDHYLDAYWIASLVTGTHATPVMQGPYHVRQFRRHDRQACHQEMLNRKYLLGGKTVAVNRHRAYEQKAISLAEYRAELETTHGKRIAEITISRLTAKKHSPVMKDQTRHLPGSMFVMDGKTYALQGYDGRHGGKPDYLVDTDGTKHNARKCIFVQNNTGLQFLG